MIATKAKDFDTIAQYLAGHQKVCIVGCGQCATTYQTGGEKQVAEMKEKLEGMGKTVTAAWVIFTPCDERITKRDLRANASAVADADAILALTCGAGAQTVAGALDIKNLRPVYPALDSLAITRLERLTYSEERCVVCGDCILAATGAICPLTVCPKGLLNGPCGGTTLAGKCEVDNTKDCAWVLIYNRMVALGQEDKLLAFEEPKDYRPMVHPRKLDKSKKAEPVAAGS